MTIRSTLAALFLVFGHACAKDSQEAIADTPAVSVRPRTIRTSKPPADVLKKELTSLQWDVTQENGTEMPFKNAYWDHKKPGIYVDVTTGQPLFSSLDKYDSGTGWPSFTRPLVAAEVVDRKSVV